MLLQKATHDFVLAHVHQQRLMHSKTYVTVNRLNQAESEARETQSWLETAVECEYITQKVGKELFELYHEVIGKLINMENNPDEWVIEPREQRI